ncbi:hypothetical protein JW877_09355 [bacterium]|nr:hypothetical protein [bacterium]
MKSTLSYILILTVFALPAFPQNLEISLENEQFYQVLYHLITACGGTPWLNSYPLDAEEVHSFLTRIEQENLTNKLIYDIKYFKDRSLFYTQNRAFGLNYFADIRADVQRSAVNDFPEHEKLHYITWLDLEGSIYPLEHLQIYAKIRLGATDSFTVPYLRPWQKNFYGYLHTGYLSYSSSGFNIQLGRQIPRWGPPFSEGLMLSGETAPCDMIRLSYKHDPFFIQYFSTRLDDYEGAGDSLYHRFISTHRIGFKAKDLEVGFSELTLYGRPGGPEWYYLNPLTIYYFEQWNHRGYDDNLFFSLDLVYSRPSWPQVYAEWLIDDFQIDFVSEPHETGWKVGLNFVPPGFEQLYANLEYTRIANWVYSKFEAYDNYLYNGQPIGFPWGCDVDRIRAGLRYQIRRDLSLQLRYERIRNGEGQIWRYFDGPVTGTKFPSGIVETTDRLELITLWYPCSQIYLQPSLEYRKVQNAANQDGHEKDLISLKFLLNIYH